MEVWKEIHGYNERYEVSNYGHVRSNDMIVNGRLQNCHHKKGRILKPYTDKEGYKGVVLCVNQKRKTFRDNLRWSTRKQNANNPITRKRVAVSKIGERNPNYKK